jgi:RNA polymerase sigma factor (sigma-70 family)
MRAEPSFGPGSLRTRRSLLSRLKNWDDQESWQEFFRTYWKLIYSVAIKAGLSDQEAEDVVQEVVLTVAKSMGTFRYEPEKCRFKTWLMRTTQRRIIDQVRKRDPAFVAAAALQRDSNRTPILEGIPEPCIPEIEAVLDEEWRKNMVDAAMDRVKRRVRPDHYQMFYLQAVKGVTAKKAASALGVSVGQAYLMKHRVARLVKAEMRKLERSGR